MSRLWAGGTKTRCVGPRIRRLIVRVLADHHRVRPTLASCLRTKTSLARGVKGWLELKSVFN